MSKVKKVSASFGMGSKWQQETYDWVKQQGGENVSEWLKCTLHHLYLKWKEDNNKAIPIRSEGVRIINKKD